MVAIAVLSGALLAVSPASAAFPGHDGGIAFVRGHQIYTIGPDGGSLTQLTSDGQNYRPKWSPDGRRVAFIHKTATGAKDIWVMAADGSSKQQVTTTGDVSAEPSWSPDGLWIAFANAGGLVKIASTAPFGTPIKLGGYYTKCGACPPEGIPVDDVPVDRFLSWSPDGQRIAVYNHDDAVLANAMWMYYVGTGQTRQVFASGGECCGYTDFSDVAWTSTGAFGYSYVKRGIHGDHPRPSRISLRGFTSQWGDTSFAPSPTGMHVVVTNHFTGAPKLSMAAADGTGRHVITRGSQPDWQPVPRSG